MVKTKKTTISAGELKARRAKARKVIAELKKLHPTAGIMLNYSNPWELLVAVILSAQCTDKKVNEVTAGLFKKYPALADYAKSELKEFEQDIRPAGFYRNKARNILASAKIINESYGGKVPRTMKELLTLPGVARKTANVVLGNAFGVVEGIAVDTHVKRLAHRLGLTDRSNPSKIEQDLMQIIPRKYWFQLTYWLIDYGRQYCPARPHDHQRCPLRKFEGTI